MKTWLYHRAQKPRVFDTEIDDMDALHEHGWRDTPSAFIMQEQDVLAVPVPTTQKTNKVKK